MIGKLLRLAVVASALVAALPAVHASPESLRAAISAMDIEALRHAGDTGSPAERRLAAGVELAWTSHGAVATTALSSAIDAQTDPRLKAAGLQQLMSLHMRRGDFAAAVAAGLQASVIEPLNAGEQQALVFVQALVGIPPTRALGDPSGRAAVTRDLAGLLRADISAGDASVAAILDTGANFSTINESSAARLGLRMLDAAVSVGSSSRDAVASRLGVASRLSIGGATFSDVVFIVLPDADLSFADGAYTIDAILGMPVFLEMKRIELARVDDGEVFAFGNVASGIGDASRNLLFAGLSPLVATNVAVGDDAIDILMLLDSGAQTTSFEGRFAEVAPKLMLGAQTITSTRGGAGGVVTSDTTRSIASADITIGAHTASLSGVNVHHDDRDNRLGILGLDVFGAEFVIDWVAGVVVASAP